ncbi:hypothetical protein LOK49_LG04G03118 [Camellia lanceoleosa]|uniref:Uncharacterized protein n=1 Tax=Camellia lanceoleosa TaxID=1840588 RepID=A0ACC0I0U1_9ERIC|nr:hypothetical protein LOK49_LG04G03118 [Camellia lanceoleosa]
MATIKANQCAAAVRIEIFSARAVSASRASTRRLPPPRQQSKNDARARVKGKIIGGGADRREAERLGVLEADHDSGSVVELRVRVCCFVGVGGESEGVSDDAFEALDCWICIAVCASHEEIAMGYLRISIEMMWEGHADMSVACAFPCLLGFLAMFSPPTTDRIDEQLGANFPEMDREGNHQL